MKRGALWLALVVQFACSTPAIDSSDVAALGSARPDIVATNAFYYYNDVDAAWAFYRDVLGFETVVDYGFAKIVRVAETSYLTLVEASEGMHSADEPKTVTLSLITDELTLWNDHLLQNEVPMRLPYSRDDSAVVNSFVAVDPEGYFLKFIRFNPHPNHSSYVAGIAAADPVTSNVKTTPVPMSVRAAAFTAYFADAESIRPFYEQLFDVSPAGEIDSVTAYQLSRSGFLLLADSDDGLHRATEKSGVTFAFFTSDVDAWHDRASRWPGFEMRTPGVLDEGGLVRVFVGYDPFGTFLEWDTFQTVPENEALLEYLP